MGSAMGKVLLSVLLVGYLAGCSAFANRSQFVPNPLRQADTVKAGASAAAPEDDDGGFFGDGPFGEGDSDGGGGGIFDGDDSGGGLF